MLSVSEGIFFFSGMVFEMPPRTIVIAVKSLKQGVSENPYE
jgi:hypothetical protein